MIPRQTRVWSYAPVGGYEPQSGGLIRGSVRDADGVPFAYTSPSPGHYPWQWYWDSCFTAIVRRRFDERFSVTRMAKNYLHVYRTLLRQDAMAEREDSAPLLQPVLENEMN